MEHEKIREVFGNEGYLKFISYYAGRHRAAKQGNGSREYLESLKRCMAEKSHSLCRLLDEFDEKP